jgi:hypothetical protein
LRARAGAVLADPAASEARPLAALDPDVICAAVVDHSGLDRSALLRRHDPHLARAVAAWLCRRHTEATLRELALRLSAHGVCSVVNPERPFWAAVWSTWAVLRSSPPGWWSLV